MDHNQFVNLAAQNIAKNGLDNNKFIDAVKYIYQSRNQFDKNIPNKTYLDVFIEVLNDVKHEKEDYAPMMTDDYWNRNLESFSYTARILPQLRTKYNRAYKIIFDGNNILEAGINPDKRGDEKAKTIWNIVERVDKPKEGDKEKSSEKTSSNQKLDKFKSAPDGAKAQMITKDLGDIKLDGKQLSAVVKFIDNLLK